MGAKGSKSRAARLQHLPNSRSFIQGDFNHQLAPIPALMAAADATTTLRVGSLVFANDYRHPIMLAKEAATLDLLSEGRFELGIGAGWLRSEYEQTGIPFDPPGIRVERMQEALLILKGAFAEQPLTFAGKHYTITHLESFPKPSQKPHPPLLIGAGSKRMLSIAAREADIIGILPKALTNGTISEDPTERFAETLAQKVEWIRQAAGERFDEIELSMVVTIESLTINTERPNNPRSTRLERHYCPTSSANAFNAHRFNRSNH